MNNVQRYENNVQLIGFVDDNVLVYEDKSPFATLTLLTIKYFIDKQGETKKKLAWHKLQFFGELVDSVKNLVFKDSYLYVSGELDYHQWETKDGDKRANTVVNVEKLIVLNNK